MRKSASEIIRNLEVRVARLEKQSSNLSKSEYKLAQDLSAVCNEDCKELILIVAGLNTGAVQKGTNKYSNNSTVKKIVKIDQLDKQSSGRILAQSCLLCTKNKNYGKLIFKMLKSGGRV